MRPDLVRHPFLRRNQDRFHCLHWCFQRRVDGTKLKNECNFVSRESVSKRALCESTLTGKSLLASLNSNLLPFMPLRRSTRFSSRSFFRLTRSRRNTRPRPGPRRASTPNKTTKSQITANCVCVFTFLKLISLPLSPSFPHFFGVFVCWAPPQFVCVISRWAIKPLSSMG